MESPLRMAAAPPDMRAAVIPIGRLLTSNKAEVAHRSNGDLNGSIDTQEKRARILEAPTYIGDAEAHTGMSFSDQPSPQGRGWPAAGASTSRSGSGEGLVGRR
jgi:hypothetical protein